jgi:hypothetical protein
MRKLGPILPGIILAVALLLPAAACSSGGVGGSLSVVEVTTAIGAAAGDTQIISWSAVLQNNSRNTVFIEMVEPVPAPGLEPMVLADNLVRTVSKFVVSGQSVVVNGSFPFNAQGLTKADIDKLQPLLTGFRVISDETLPVPKK